MLMGIGFIGAGNMAGAIIKGLRRSGFKDDIFLTDVQPDKAKIIADEANAVLCQSNEEIIEKAEYVLLAVKPDMYKKVLESLSEKLSQKKPVIISIAAGTCLDAVTEYAGVETLPVIRVMPNVNALVLEAVSALCKNSHATEENLNYVKSVFDAIGTTVLLDEKYFTAYTGIAGCSPAFAFLFIDSLANAAVKHGIPKETAVKIASQALLGSAKNLLHSGEVPWAMIEKVCSPGGTTIEGVLALEEYGFNTAVVKAVDATIAKDNYLKEILSK
jgi:pyrroline-5-carboxylate reductase